MCRCMYGHIQLFENIYVSILKTSDFLSFDAIDTNNGVWVYFSTVYVCVCGGDISCSFLIDFLVLHSGGL